MKLHAPTDLLAIDPKFAVSIIQQPNQVSFPQSANPVDGLSGSLFPAVATASIGVAVILIYISAGFGRQQTRCHKCTATRQQHIQTLERIWQMTAKRND